MSNWILMNIFPLFLLMKGTLLLINPPPDINTTYGYRSKRSKQSQSVWETSQKKYAIFQILSSILCLLTISGVEALGGFEHHLWRVAFVPLVGIMFEAPRQLTEHVLRRRGEHIE